MRVKSSYRGKKTCVRGKRTRGGKRKKRCYRYKNKWVRRWVKKPAVYVAGTRTRKAEGCPAGEKCIGPYVTAFDQATGEVVWSTEPLDTQPGSDVYGSPIIFDGVLMIGVSGGSAELGDEADRYAFQGSMNFLDVDKGKVLKKTYTVHPPTPEGEEPPDDFGGAGIWSTPAVDTEDKVAFVGTANPFRPQAEHANANAVAALRHRPGQPDVRRDHRLVQGQRRRVLPRPVAAALLRHPRQPAAVLPAGDRLVRRHRPGLRRGAEPVPRQGRAQAASAPARSRASTTSSTRRR